MAVKQPISDIDATPIKNVYLSIIADYDLETAVCELIDNSIDAWRAGTGKSALEINITIDTARQEIRITDNAGGVRLDDLKVLVSPGSAINTAIPDPIGVFGVGSKRSVVALASRIHISTRFGTERTYRIEYDDEWIQDPESDWNVPAFEVQEITPSSTLIELSSLRTSPNAGDVERLKGYLRAAYAFYLQDENIWLIVNDERIEPRFFDQWAFPPDFPPTTFKKNILHPNGTVKFAMTVGLTTDERTLGGDYGVFVYCNRRLIARALRSAEVGFMSGLAGVDHHGMNLARILITFEGDARGMPWTSRKDGVYYSHSTFQAVREDIISAVENCTKWSKALKPEFDTKVKPYTEGEIRSDALPASDQVKSHLPKPPRVRRDHRETIIEANRVIARAKPFVKGLYESVIAAELLLKQKGLTQRSRIAWIILDSTVEIACKEYLVYSAVGISDKRLADLKREELQKEVETTVLNGDDIWNRFKYNYKRRNLFVHQKADASVSEEDTKQFLHDVKRFLTQAFDLRFPA